MKEEEEEEEEEVEGKEGRSERKRKESLWCRGSCQGSSQNKAERLTVK